MGEHFGKYFITNRIIEKIREIIEKFIFENLKEEKSFGTYSEKHNYHYKRFDFNKKG